MALSVRRLLDGASWVDVVEAGLRAMQVHLAATGTRQLLAEVDAASNHDGDLDSTASIAGQLYGAKHGLPALPADAVTRIDVLEPLREHVQIKNYTDIGGDLMDMGRSYTDIGELNRHACRSIQS